MKRFFTILIAIVVIVFISVQVFRVYNSNNILSNQAVFQVYSDLDKSEIDDYFGLEPGTFDPQKHMLVCGLPVTASGFKPGVAGVNFNMEGIDCNQEFDERTHIKYDNTVLNNQGFRLMIVRAGQPLILIDPNTTLGSHSIIASKALDVNYMRGRINNIVISADRTYNYCSQ